MSEKFTANIEVFRNELARQLFDFPKNNRYNCLFRLSQISSLYTFAHCVFIFTDSQTNEVKLLKREWQPHDLSYIFAPGVYKTDKLKFTDTHKIVVNKDLAGETKPVNTPLPTDGFVLDGVNFSLVIYQYWSPLAELHWKLDKQLTGNLKKLVAGIYAEAGDFHYD